MKQYHLSFNQAELKPESITVLKRFITTQHFFKQSESVKLEMLKQLNAELSLIYGVEKATDIKILNYYLGIGLCGGYFPHNKEIILNKCSLVTFLHEYAHHLFNMQNTPNTEERARGFSHSLYFNATPKLFKSAVLRGLLVFQKTFKEHD